MHERFQEAVKYRKGGNLNDIVHSYTRSIEATQAFAAQVFLQYQLAHLHWRVSDDEDAAYEQLKSMIHKGGHYAYPWNGAVGAARNMLAEVIYNRVLNLPVAWARTLLIQDWEDGDDCLPQKRDPSANDSITGVIVLRATAYVANGDRVKAKNILDDVFTNCIKGLQDAIGSNDCTSFRFLSRALAIAGLEKDARIAFSAFFSLVDSNVLHDASLGKIGAGLGAEAEAGEPSEDLAFDYHCKISCSGDCGKTWRTFRYPDQPLYHCLDCVNCSLCVLCYQKRLNQNKGEPNTHWRTFCGRNHRYLRIPVEGWRGVKAGTIIIGDGRVLFTEWLSGVKKKWRNLKSEDWPLRPDSCSIGSEES
ncbi:hypothetical protein MMC28_008042 [Mycoblastus sanguinarius]|nr:hypothetical protein [Mycoblastus sanguinarius]